MMIRWHLPAVLALASAMALGADLPARQDAPTVDEDTAKAYNEFRERLSEGVGRTVKRIATRYELRPEQQEMVRRLVSKSADGFLEENGHEVFDLFQRARALRDLMRAERMGWEEVPPDIKRELAERALPVLDAFEKRVTAFSKDFGRSLDSEQQKRFQQDRQRAERGFRMARVQMRIMSGRGVLGGGPPAAAGRGPGGEGPRRPPPGPRLDPWERYVSEFIRRYRLDEVQKVQATDLLSKYKGMAERLARGPEVPSATQPAGKTGSAEGFRRRLAEVRSQRRPIRELFERLKAELDKIPTAVQRKLAEEDRAKERSAGAPAGPSTSRPRDGAP